MNQVNQLQGESEHYKLYLKIRQKYKSKRPCT